jgi:hypothetical protein
MPLDIQNKEENAEIWNWGYSTEDGIEKNKLVV